MEQMSRMDIRLPLSVKEMIETAATLTGRTRTDFLLGAAVEKAKNVISEHHTIQLSLRDQRLLAEALSGDEGWEPDDSLKDLAKEYRENVISK